MLHNTMKCSEKSQKDELFSHSVNVRLGVEKEGRMARKGYTPEQIINQLREADVFLSQGATVGEVSRKIGIRKQTYYRWIKEYGGCE